MHLDRVAVRVPAKYRAALARSMKVLKPSSIHGYSRSFEPTIIGNHWWPNSCAITHCWSSRVGLFGREREHGVLHPLDRTFDASSRATRDSGYHCSLKYLIASRPILLTSGHLSAVGPIERLDQYAVVAARVPAEVGPGGEREVADVVGA